MERVREVPASTLVVPVRVAQDQVKAWTEALVPGTFRGEGSGTKTLTAWFLRHDWNYWWRYDLKRSPLTMGFEENRIKLAASLAGDLSARWDTIPGEIRSQVEAEAGVEAALTLGADWRLQTRSRIFVDLRKAEVPIGIRWNGNFFGENVSIAGAVRQALQPSLEDLGGDLDRWLAGWDLRPVLETAWRDLQEPRPLPGPGSLWFSLAPRAVSVGTLAAGAGQLEIPLTLTFYPAVTSGPRPLPVYRPLPQAEPPPALLPQMLLNLPVALRWDDAEALTRDLWRPGTPWEAGNGAKLRLNNLDASTDGDRVLLRLEAAVTPPWSGSEIDAVLWLRARPVWDPANRTLALADTALEVRTRDYLASAASWLLAPGWIAALEKTLVWELGGQLDALRVQTSSALAALPLGADLTLEVVVNRLEVADLSLTAEGFELLARVEGVGSVTWGPRPPQPGPSSSLRPPPGNSR